MNNSDLQINEIIDRSQIRQFPLMIVGISILFAGYALAQLIILQETGYPIMVVFALFCAACLIILLLVFKRIEQPEKYSNWFMGGIAFLVLASTLLRLFATREPKQSANLILFMVAAGVVFVSSRWFLPMLAVTLGGWVAFILFIETEPGVDKDAVFWGLVLFSSAITAYILHYTRARVVLRSVKGEITERQRKEESNRQAMQLKTSAGVGQQITSILDPEKLLHQITSLIKDNYQLRYVGVFLPKNALLPVELDPVVEAGEWITTTQTPDEESWMTQIQHVYQNSMITGIDESAPFDPSKEQTTLQLPLKMGTSKLGVLVLQSSDKSKITQSEAQVFHLLANQVSVALENARLYDQIMQMNQELEVKVDERTRELQTAYAQLERLDKTKSDFITIASHELKTPLTLINVYNQMFCSDELIENNETYRKWSEQIDKGAVRLNEIVERMEDVAMIDSQSLDLFMAPTDLQFLFASIQSNLNFDLAGRDIRFNVTADLSDLPEVEADTVALEKAFMQLLQNSIKYTPDGGTIEVNGRFHPQQANSDAYVEIIVSDSGIGIAPELKELIFEKFYQTGDVKLHSSGKSKFKGGGAGIGLAIAKGIVEAHQGNIWVESQGYDEDLLPGSQFHVTLPLRQTAV